MVDLHSHSSASDGAMAPARLAEFASEKKLRALALTDHDTVSGLADCASACRKFGVEFVPGIEITVEWPQGEFHLLGFGIRRVSCSMNDLLLEVQKGRLERNLRIVQKMNEAGIECTIDDIARNADGTPFTGTLGRPHFADFLVRRGIVRTRQQGFDKFLGGGRPWYERKAGADLDRAIAALHDCGAVPVLAHPLSLYSGWKVLDGLLPELKERGIVGIEAWHPAARVGECIRLEEMARACGLFVTAGSDFHGEHVRADRHLGRTAGNRPIDDRFYFEELAAALG